MQDSDTTFRQWRLKMGLTQKSAAHTLGYSVSQIAEYDRGSQIPPKIVMTAMQFYEMHPEKMIGNAA